MRTSNRREMDLINMYNHYTRTKKEGKIKIQSNFPSYEHQNMLANTTHSNKAQSLLHGLSTSLHFSLSTMSWVRYSINKWSAEEESVDATIPIFCF